MKFYKKEIYIIVCLLLVVGITTIIYLHWFSVKKIQEGMSLQDTLGISLNQSIVMNDIIDCVNSHEIILNTYLNADYLPMKLLSDGTIDDPNNGSPYSCYAVFNDQIGLNNKSPEDQIREYQSVLDILNRQRGRKAEELRTKLNHEMVLYKENIKNNRFDEIIKQINADINNYKNEGHPLSEYYAKIIFSSVLTFIKKHNTEIKLLRNDYYGDYRNMDPIIAGGIHDTLTSTMHILKFQSKSINELLIVPKVKEFEDKGFAGSGNTNDTISANASNSFSF